MSSKPRRLHLGAILPAALVVILAGSVVAGGAASASRAFPIQSGFQGVVTSVNGSGVIVGTCLSSNAGTFTMVGHIRQGIVTVDVTSTTIYTDAAVTSPSFADVCVGDQVKVLGTLSSGALAATAVTIVPARAEGIVASVNGDPTATTCGTTAPSGGFTLAARHRDIVTVVVTSGTTFSDAAVTSATFADICVGDQVKVLGTLSSGALAATLVTIVPAQAHGIVTSVTVGTATSTCGTGTQSGSFTLGGFWGLPVTAAAPRFVTVVGVTPGTTFTDPALTSATFADVCVGDQVKVLGTLSSGALAATLVTIVPAQAQGTVTSVTVGTTASTTPSSCGSGGSAGSFTLGGFWGLPVTAAAPRFVTVVGVTPGTTFTDPALTSATFADVCVGDQVTALGTLSSGALAATLVTIVPAQAQGIVTSVTVGTTASTTPSCGSGGSAGSFTLGGFWAFPVATAIPQRLTTVDVTATTTYTDAAITSPSFADVCVGDQVKALGTLSSGVLAATAVTILPAQAQGLVTSLTVEGGPTSTTTSSCGNKGSTGSFTVAGLPPIAIVPLPVAAMPTRLITTVDVTGTTTFTDAAVTSPSFANVCVGGHVEATGTLSSGVLTATAVTILPPVSFAPGHGNRRG